MQELVSGRGGMDGPRATLALLALAFVPCPAAAHGQSALALGLLLPSLTACSVLVLLAWIWRASVRKRLLTTIAVLAAGGAMTAVNYLLLASVPPSSPYASLADILWWCGPTLVPSIAWVICLRKL